MSNFKPGDKVSVLEHVTAPLMYPDHKYTVPASDGWVIARDGVFRDRTFCVQKVVDGQLKSDIVPFDYLSLVEAGPGFFRPGVSRPFSDDELRQQRFDAFCIKLEETLKNCSHQGYSNPATFLAVTYLANDRRFYEMVPSLQRKDGTINPNKVATQFHRLGLKIDEWAYQAPIDVPAEFAGWRLAQLSKLNVNWYEVAKQFARQE